VSYALFEAWHTFSHAYHVPGNTQLNVAHVLLYAMSISTLFAVMYLSGTSHLRYIHTRWIIILVDNNSL
jgi:hypothetical protein